MELSQEIIKQINDTFIRMYKETRFLFYESCIFLGADESEENENMIFEISEPIMELPLDDPEFDSWNNGDSIDFSDMSRIERKEVVDALLDEEKYVKVKFYLVEDQIQILIESEKPSLEYQELECSYSENEYGVPRMSFTLKEK